MTALNIGATASITRTILSHDIEQFAKLSLDYNPIHFDDEFAARTLFRKRIAHGMLGVSLVSGGLTKLIGDGNIWLSQSIDFLKPIYVDDTLTVNLEVLSIDNRRVHEIGVEIVNQKTEIIISGEVKCMMFLVNSKGQHK